MNLHMNELLQTPIKKRLTGQHCVLWVSSAELVMHEVAVPKAPKRKWHELIPWMLEEKLLQAPEDSHFVICGQEDTQLSVLVTARQQMQQWQEAAASAGLDDYVLVPDFMALPWQPGQISIASHGEQVLIRHGQFKGFAVPPDFAWFMLRRLLQQSEAALLLDPGFPQQELPQALQSRVQGRLTALDWQKAPVPAGVNLLCGEFRLQKRTPETRAWLASAALLLLTLGLAFVSLDLQNKHLQSQVDALTERNRAEFFRLFPGLSIRSGDIRTTLETYISGRFQQRDSLNSPAIRALLAADRVVANCNCGLESLAWTGEGLQLQMPLTAAESVDRWQLADYQKQITAEADSGLSVILLPEND